MKTQKTRMKTGLTALLLFTSILITSAQEGISLRHIEGIKAIDFTGGIGKNCFNAEIGYVHFVSDIFFFRVTGNFEKTSFPTITLSDYALKPSVDYTLFKLGENVFINTEVGAFAGVESNTEYKPLDNITYDYPVANKFIYGGFLGANLEIYINANVSLFGTFQQHYIVGSDYGNWKYQLNAGFRFILN
jgi:hypothetical protein